MNFFRSASSLKFRISFHIYFGKLFLVEILWNPITHTKFLSFSFFIKEKYQILVNGSEVGETNESKTSIAVSEVKFKKISII